MKRNSLDSCDAKYLSQDPFIYCARSIIAVTLTSTQFRGQIWRIFWNIQVIFTSCFEMFEKRVNEQRISERLYFYFRLRVLKISTALDEPGTVNWEVALCLLLAWIICYLCVFKGVKSTGKVRKLSACILKCYEK